MHAVSHGIHVTTIAGSLCLWTYSVCRCRRAGGAGGLKKDIGQGRNARGLGGGGICVRRLRHAAVVTAVSFLGPVIERLRRHGVEGL
jgi:hypothetical protein